MSLHDAGPSSGRHAGTESPWTTTVFPDRRRNWRRPFLIGAAVFIVAAVVLGFATCAAPAPGGHDKAIGAYLMPAPGGADEACPGSDDDLPSLFGDTLYEFESAVERCFTQDGVEVRVALFGFRSEQAAVAAIDEVVYPSVGETATTVGGVTRGTTLVSAGATRTYGRNGDIVIVIRTSSANAQAVALAGSLLQAQNKRF